MNGVTKVLIVLVFALSVVFAASQVILYGKRENYGDAYNTARKARDTALSQKAEAEGQLKDTQIARDTVKMRLETENLGLQADLAQGQVRQRELELLTGELNSTVQQSSVRITALEGDIAKRDGSIEELRATVAQRDGAVTQHLDKIGGLETTVAQRDATIGQLDHDLTETKKALRVTSESEEYLLATIGELKERGIDVPPVALPIVNGRVVRVDLVHGVAVVDKGEDAGVKPNTQFTVYDGSQYVARLVIHDVQPTNSVGIIRLVADGQEVKEGDKVTTEIP